MPRRSRRTVPAGAPDLGPDLGPAPEWSARLIANGGPAVPDYGSEDWHALADNDPAKVAATVAAAEAWRRSTHPDAIADRVRLELAASRDVAAAEAVEAAELARRAVAEPVAARAGRPTLAELAVEREDWTGLVAARAQEARTDAAFDGLGTASRTVLRRRAREARRPAPLQDASR